MEFFLLFKSDCPKVICNPDIIKMVCQRMLIYISIYTESYTQTFILFIMAFRHNDNQHIFFQHLCFFSPKVIINQNVCVLSLNRD